MTNWTGWINWNRIWARRDFYGVSIPSFCVHVEFSKSSTISRYFVQELTSSWTRAPEMDSMEATMMMQYDQQKSGIAMLFPTIKHNEDLSSHCK